MPSGDTRASGCLLGRFAGVRWGELKALCTPGSRLTETQLQRLPSRSDEDGHRYSYEARSKGRQLSPGIAAAGRCFHACRSDGRSEADRADGGRIRIEGSFAPCQGSREQEAWTDGRAGEKGRRGRFDGRRSAGGIRRSGPRQNFHPGAHPETFDLTRLFRKATGAPREREPFHSFFLRTPPEEKKFSPTCLPPK